MRLSDGTLLQLIAQSESENFSPSTTTTIPQLPQKDSTDIHVGKFFFLFNFFFFTNKFLPRRHVTTSMTNDNDGFSDDDWYDDAHRAFSLLPLLALNYNNHNNRHPTTTLRCPNHHRRQWFNHQVEQTRLEPLKLIRKRKNGFDPLERWALKEIRDHAYALFFPPNYFF